MKFYSTLLLSLVAVFFYSLCHASAGDTVRISHTYIQIDTIDYGTSTIRAMAELTVHPKQNGVNGISIALLELNVDSVTYSSGNLLYAYNDSVLRVAFPSALNMGDSILLKVYYQGAPQMDGSGWGGFYFTGVFAFNLGVGFQAVPHAFGRAWFPCIDEFTAKGTYEFRVTTPDTYKAFCNGVLQSSIDNLNGTKTWHWKMNQKIPSYLASVAVAPFYTMHRTYSGIPCEFAILPNDSTTTISSFANFPTAVSTFIDKYGPYPFDKIGFVITPVVYGGMEHASSIHLSKDFVTGSLAYETLYAHELAHMWWGDKVTCKTSSDMWLNEGFATFNEHLYTQQVYGNDEYKTSFRNDHKNVLQKAHITDSTYWAHNNLSENYTYATLSVYTKGALTIHTLRNYMGDSAFFQGCKDYMSNRAYGNANSFDFRDDLSASSGMNMNDFFDDWILTPGFPHFSIDSFVVVPTTALYDVTVYTKQKRKGANHLSKMKVEFNFSDGANQVDHVATIDALTNSFTVSIPFHPTFVCVDRNEKMMDAITDYEKKITNLGSNVFPETGVSLNVIDTGNASCLVRIEHSWVAPDGFKGNPGIRISDYHYWKVDGVFNSGFQSKATFLYDGSNGGNGYMDNTLITGTEDSLVILQRGDAGEDWTVVKGYIHNTNGNVNDKRGSFVVDTLKKGEYAFGYLDYSLKGISSRTYESSDWVIFPNPSNGTVNIKTQGNGKAILSVYSMKGDLLLEKNFEASQGIQFSLKDKAKGTYLVKVSTNEKSSAQTFVLE